jgi:hypothetical protein
MRLDARLNLVIPVTQDDGTTIFIHSAPISREVFETYFLVISKTFSEIYTEGLNIVAGPRVAKMMLRKVATQMGDGVWEDVQFGLIQEIRRLTNIAVPGANGWTQLPFHLALERRLLDEEAAWEAENTIVFFTVSYLMHKRPVMAAVMQRMNDLWGMQTTSSNVTAYIGSLTTSTAPESSGETVKTPLVVY